VLLLLSEVWLVRLIICMLSWRGEEVVVVLLTGGEGVLVDICLCASSTLYSFGLVILARFFPWLIELCAELLLKIVILFGAVSLYKESPKLRKSSSSEGLTQAADFLW